MSDKHLNLAKQNSQAIEDVSNEPHSPGPVYADDELVRRAQKEDPWAIEQLVLRYQKKVHAMAYQMLSGDAEEARDRTQDAFLQAFRKIKQFRGKSSFYTWLYRIVINTCIDARRRRQRWKEIFSPGRLDKNKDHAPQTSLEDFPDTNGNSDPLATVSRRQLEGDVKSAMNKLSKRQRTIFQLKVFQEMSIAEIAESMGLIAPVSLNQNEELILSDKDLELLDNLELLREMDAIQKLSRIVDPKGETDSQREIDSDTRGMRQNADRQFFV